MFSLLVFPQPRRTVPAISGTSLLFAVGASVFEYWNLRRYLNASFATTASGARGEKDLSDLYKLYKEQSEQLQQTIQQMEEIRRRETAKKRMQELEQRKKEQGNVNIT